MQLKSKMQVTLLTVAQFVLLWLLSLASLSFIMNSYSEGLCEPQSERLQGSAQAWGKYVLFSCFTHVEQKVLAWLGLSVNYMRAKNCLNK